MGNAIEWIFATTAIFGVLIYIYLVWNFNYWIKRGVRGPKPRPLLGNMPGMVTYSRHTVLDLHDHYCKYKNREKFIGIFLGRQPRLLLLDPELIRDVLISNLKSFHKNDFFIELDPILDRLVIHNPFVLSDSEWKDKRSEITPALTTNRIKASYPIMLEVCKKLTKYLKSELKNVPKDGINVKDLAARFTVEVVSNCVYGLEARAFEDKRCVLLEQGSTIFQSINLLKMFVFLVMPFLRKSLNLRFISQSTEEFFINLMNDSITQREQSKDDRVDFLNYLLQLKAKKNLSLLDMASSTLTFFLDGFETSSVLICNCLYALAKNSQVQEKLRQEIRTAISEKGEISYENLFELSYLDCVINETLRLYGPITFLSKVCTIPHTFTNSDGTNLTVEKGVIVSIPVYSLHRDERYYKDPENFIPERFSKENGGSKKYKDMGVFIPFGDGPRICLGMRFGLTQSKAAIAEIVLNWKISLNKKTKPEFIPDAKNLMLVIKGGTWLDFKEI